MSAVAYLDGVKVFMEDETTVLAYYDDWAVAKGYYRKMDMRAIMFEQGYTEEQVEAEDDRMDCEFSEWCNAWGVLAYG